MGNQYFGKYKAVVCDIKDPEKRGRIRVNCPAVLGTSKSPWCEVCVPVAYDGGGDFCLPSLGETVWIEFEQGNPSKPIWVGGWWSTEKTPVNYENIEDIRCIEYHGSKIEFSSDGIVITGGGATIKLKEGNIYLN